MKRPHSGPFSFLSEREVWTNPPGSTNSSGTNLDSRRLAPQARSAGGVSLMDETNISLPLRQTQKGGRKAPFLCLEEKRMVDEPSWVRQIRLERIWTAAGWPRRREAPEG